MVFCTIIIFRETGETAYANPSSQIYDPNFDMKVTRRYQMIFLVVE